MRGGRHLRRLWPLLRSKTRPWPLRPQVFEEDGRRTQVWRGKGDPCPALYTMLRPSLASLPPHYQRARNAHLGVNPEVRGHAAWRAHASCGLVQGASAGGSSSSTSCKCRRRPHFCVPSAKPGGALDCVSLIMLLAPSLTSWHALLSPEQAAALPPGPLPHPPDHPPSTHALPTSPAEAPT